MTAGLKQAVGADGGIGAFSWHAMGISPPRLNGEALDARNHHTIRRGVGEYA